MNADDYIKKAYDLAESHDWDNAIINLKFAEKIDPKKPIIHEMLYSAYGVTRNRELAKKHFLIFKKLNPIRAKIILDEMDDMVKKDLGL